MTIWEFNIKKDKRNIKKKLEIGINNKYIYIKAKVLTCHIMFHRKEGTESCYPHKVIRRQIQSQ